MKAITFRHKKVIHTDVPMPALKEGEALVRVLTAGICATDIAIFHGYAEFDGIPGHEFAGVVEKCPDYPGLTGKRVVADINFGCGKCSDEKHCPKRRVLGIRGHDGAFAEYCAINAKNLYPVDDAIATHHAVFAEILAAALEITRQVHIKSNRRIAVIGDGPLGILSALALRQYSTHVILLGRHDQKLAIAGKQGVKTYPVAAGESAEDVAFKLGRFDITVDATGNPEGINWCIGLTKPSGTVAAKTTVPEKPAIDLSAVVVNELSIKGSRCGDTAFALDFLKNRCIDVEPLIDAVYPFSAFDRAFSRAMEQNSLKVLVDFSTS